MVDLTKYETIGTEGDEAPPDAENFKKYLIDYDKLKKNTYKYWSQGIIKKKIMILEKDFQLME